MKRALFLALVALAIIAPAFMENKETGTTSSPAASSYMEDVSVVNTKAGRVDWKMSSKKVGISPDDQSARLKVVTIELPDEDMRVNAEAGVFRMDTMALDLSGNIEAKTKDLLITTDHISLDSEKGEISTNGMVLIEGNGFRINGLGMRAHEQKVWIEKDVEAVLF